MSHPEFFALVFETVTALLSSSLFSQNYYCPDAAERRKSRFYNDFSFINPGFL